MSARGVGPGADASAGAPPGGGPVLCVLGDSLSFHGPRTAHPADDPRLWPHVAAAALGGRAELHAGMGWTARHAWRAVRGDPRVWVSVREADALVLGVGGMDTLPSPVPTALRELIPVLRPDGLRRRVRAGHDRAVGPVSAALARLGGPPVALPPHQTVAHLERCRDAVTILKPDLPVVLLLPAVHRAPYYRSVHTGRARAVAALTAWARAHDVTTVPTGDLVADHVLGGHGNPDGLHWGWTAHTTVGHAVADALWASAKWRR